MRFRSWLDFDSYWVPVVGSPSADKARSRMDDNDREVISCLYTKSPSTRQLKHSGSPGNI